MDSMMVWVVVDSKMSMEIVIVLKEEQERKK